MTSLMALLSCQQMHFVDKMSNVFIRESSDVENTSTDNELAVMNNNSLNMRLAKRMIKSKDKVDNRLVDIMRLRKADQLKTAQQKKMDGKQVTFESVTVNKSPSSAQTAQKYVTMQDGRNENENRNSGIASSDTMLIEF